tara:strand:+ start:1932 stop:2618 length:687 start_codon:yes stop_codon:yes gene_type:complete
MKLGLGLNLSNKVGGWTPANISSLIHWYRFDTGITQEEDNDVTAWNDQKGSNNLTSTGVSSASPTYSSGAVLFNASNDILTFGSSLDLTTFAIYARIECASFSGDFLFEETSQEFIKIHDANNIRMKIQNGSRHDVTGLSLSADTKFNIGVEREDTADTNDDQIFVFINNDSKSIGGGGGGTQFINQQLEITTLGQPADDVKFYEVVICNNALSASDRSNLNTYLNKI